MKKIRVCFCRKTEEPVNLKWPVQGGPDHTEYVADVLHLCSLLHAVTLLHLRRDSNLDNLVPSKLGPRKLP